MSSLDDLKGDPIVKTITVELDEDKATHAAISLSVQAGQCRSASMHAPTALKHGFQSKARKLTDVAEAIVSAIQSAKKEDH